MHRYNGKGCDFLMLTGRLNEYAVRTKAYGKVLSEQERQEGEAKDWQTYAVGLGRQLQNPWDNLGKRVAKPAWPNALRPGLGYAFYLKG